MLEYFLCSSSRLLTFFKTNFSQTQLKCQTALVGVRADNHPDLGPIGLQSLSEDDKSRRW